MYKLPHSSNNSLQDFDALIKELEEVHPGIAKIFNKHLYQMTRKTEDNLDALVRMYRESESGAGSGGGGGATFQKGYNIPKKSVPVCNLVYSSEAFGYDGTEFNSSQPVDFSAWNRHQMEVYKGISETVTLTKVIGHLIIEGKNSQEMSEHFIEMSLELGSGQIGANHLLSFACGFERYNAERLKFFLDVFEYQRELSNSNSTLLINKIPIASRKFRSDQSILVETPEVNRVALDEYVASGLRLYFDLTLYGTV
jgi:hypothetical protein